MEKGIAPPEALKLLMEGNASFVKGKPRHPHADPRWRKELVKGQHPFAVVVGCSDSRIPPEIIFDRGAGDLFVVRTAGNVVDDVALGSIEYAVEHLGARLVVLLGHSHCGAVKAALAGGEHPGKIGHLVKHIQPAVAASKGEEGDEWLNCVSANVDHVADKVRLAEPIMSELVKEGRVKVIGAVYHLESGEVKFHIKPCDWKKAK